MHISSQHIILGGFAQLEQENIKTNITRVNEAITNEINRLNSVSEDWAPWDDTRDFIAGKQDDYPTTKRPHFQKTAFRSARLT